jgi:hypothetical protein
MTTKRKPNDLAELIFRARCLLFGALAVITNEIVYGRIAEFLGKPHRATREELFKTRSVLIYAADENTLMRAPMDRFLASTGVPG